MRNWNTGKVIGSRLADTLVGTLAGDIIYARAGNDVVHAGEGNDRVFADTGNDTVDGQGGDDIILGGGDDDRLQGGSGDDYLSGDAGNDSLEGGEGQDRLDGGAGGDRLEGGAGDDVVIGGLGSDSLLGDDGDDSLNGENGNDTLDGGSGNDDLRGGSGADTLLGGEGNDRLRGDSGDDLLDGGDGDDMLQGGSGFDTLIGGEGNDRLRGDVGDDLLDGGIGRDDLQGGNGSDTLIGGAGNDRLRGDNGDDTLLGGDDQDTLEGGEGDDELEGGEGRDRLFGGEGDDTLDGGAGNDMLQGDAGNDTLAGGDGDDELFGGLGNDFFDGGDGQDVVRYCGDQTRYDVSADATFAVVVEDSEPLQNRNYGTDSVRHVEALVFDDGTLRFEAQLAHAAPENDGGGSDGFHPGTGNSDGNFLVSDNTDHGIEAALKAKGRYAGELDAEGIVYDAQPGFSSGDAGTWNFDYSVISYDGLPLAGLDITITADFIDLLGQRTQDVMEFDADAHEAEHHEAYYQDPSGDTQGLQNSQNIGWFAPEYEPYALGTYALTLTVRDDDGNLLTRTTITVDLRPDIVVAADGSGDFTSIQEAIDAASDGDTIVVAAGFYAIDQTIVIDKEITLLGAQAGVDARSAAGLRAQGDEAETVIDGGGTLDTLIRIAADGVVIDGFDIGNGTGDLIESETAVSDPQIRYNFVHGSTGDEAIQLRGAADAVVEFNNVADTFGDGINLSGGSTDGIVRFNEVHDIGSANAAIYLDGAENTTVEGNLIYDVTLNDGIKFGPGDGTGAAQSGGSAIDNVIHDVAEDGISVYMSDVTVSGNDISHSNSGNGSVFVEFDVDNIAITGNAIHDNGTAGDGNTTFAIRIGKAGHPTNVTITGNTFTENEAQIFAVPGSVTNLGTLEADNTFDSGDVIVTNLTVGVVFGDFATIQAAIDAASEGDVIFVAAGVYAENLTIGKSITLLGAQVGVDARGRVDVPETVIDGKVTLTADGDDVTLDGFTVQDGAFSTPDTVGVFLRAGATGVTITNTILERDGEVDGDSSRGIMTTHNGGNDDLTVSQNSFSGWANGVYLNPGANDAVIADNDFTGNNVGMSTDGPHGVTVTGNLFADNVVEGLGIGPGGAEPSLTLGDNVFQNNPVHIGLYTDMEIDASTNVFDGIDLDAGVPDNDAITALAGTIGDALDGNPYSGVIYLQPGTLFVAEGASIQAAIDMASEGDTIVIGAGAFNEAVIVHKALHFVGQGGGQTVVTPPSGSAFTLQGDLGAGNTVSFEGLALNGAEKFGIHASGVVLGSLLVADSSFEGNAVNGLRVIDSPGLGHVGVSDSSFVENGHPAGASGDGDLLFFQYTGDVTLSGITIDGGDRPIDGSARDGDHAAENAIQFRSDSGEMGTVVITDVTISGTYEKTGVGVYNYDSVDGLSVDGLDIDIVSGWGKSAIIDGVGGDIDASAFAGFSYSDLAEFGGDDGDNVFTGAGGNDLLAGLGGDDTLSGGQGADQIVGGTGVDVLSGGGIDLAVDVFVFADGDAGGVESHDRIVDFETGLDRIDLSDFSLSGFEALEMVVSGGDLTVRIDDDDMIVVEGVSLLQEADFLL